MAIQANWIVKVPEVVAGITSITTMVSGWYNLQQARDKSKLKRKVSDVERGIVEPVRISASEKRNSIILLGPGGSGKTSLIKNVFHHNKATPERRTDEYTIYKSSQTVDDQTYHFFVSDYVGQNLGSLVGSFVEQQKTPYSEMTYGYINSLVLMVDLFPPKHSPLDPDPQPTSEPDLDRISHHLQQWNETALDAIFGLLTVPELSYVCLFINKYDLISDNSVDSRRRIEKLYERLFAYLSMKVGGLGVECEMMLGSAGDGGSLSKLLERFTKFSVPAKSSSPR